MYNRIIFLGTRAACLQTQIVCNDCVVSIVLEIVPFQNVISSRSLNKHACRRPTLAAVFNSE